MRCHLLLAAAVAVTSAWSIPFFSESESSSPRLHPLSPPETDPANARAKRQAHQVYVDGDVSVTVDQSGGVETGPWGQWTADGQCSRSCGSGVQIEKRQCSGGGCTGPSVRYISCNVDACPAGSADFRSAQCAAKNDEALNGQYYKWVPYKGKNKCELLCKPEGISNFYYKWGDKVDNGTPCDSKGTDICVDGVCLPLGCDGKLGSEKKLDKCGKCDGTGDTCKTLEGSFDERNLSPGYHDVIKLPVGATAIKIWELRETPNNLALKNSTGEFVLNGNSMIQTETDVEVAGTVFEYDDVKKESLSAAGPLKEEVTVALLHRKGSKDSAIKYEFSIPVDDDVAFMYKVGPWTPCTVTCGMGVETREPFCVDVKANARVSDDICEEHNATKPETEKECRTVDCDAEWHTGEWEECSATCGQAGEQYRVVYCHQMFKDGRRITVEDGNCTAERPPVKQNCNRFSCPEWQAGPWSACSEKCGDAHQYRSVTCRSEKEGEEGKLLAADQCPKDQDMETERNCNLGPCEGLKFTTTDWKLCTKCNDTEEAREVKCVDTQGRAYPLEKCLSNGTTEIPVDTRTCATQPPCIYEWTSSEWSKCSTECGHGHKTRRVVCAIHQQGDLEVVDEGHCGGEKPEAKEECTNEEKCTGMWFSGPWTECTAECDSGTQSRVSVCLNYDHKPEPKWCDESEKPENEQECNTQACPTCFDSEFGCCPDNSTFATGDFYAGCSNCTLSEFGCCADNVTDATGPNALGCLEYVELETAAPVKEEMKEDAVEGSGAEGVVEEIKECKVTAKDGTEASVECSSIAPVTADEVDLISGNETENATIHCSKTEFKCCPDWFTPRTSDSNEGCEVFVQGTCNGTQFGCCPDDVTLARGPNFEGCGEPTCAASLYGCCKDRKTIAFGPHFDGCDRSSFPCELSSFGCCPDGETAALGKNGTGCGENCLTTKFGCCPDGKMTSKGKNNEGCGCEFAQYGCCPDGKTTAKGAGFYGCPESCAQSQFGCCPDGKTAARGGQKEGCPCQYTRFGCCPDGETTALGDNLQGCDDCRYAKHGCCADMATKALGPDHAGCPSTTVAPFLQGGTVAPSKISACSLTQDQGRQCPAGFKLLWFYDMAEGRCSQFWYGGCDGNENRFATKDQCETICVEPPSKGRCYLPKVEGPAHCQTMSAKYFYDAATRNCVAFWYRGCLGNANNFNSFQDCMGFCDGVTMPTEPPATTAPPPPPPTPAPREEVAIRPHETPDISAPAAPAAAPVDSRDPRPTNPYQTMEDVCRSLPDAGPCTNFVQKFFYDVSSGKCQRFRYGGCGGNLNSFTEESDCEMRCAFMRNNRGVPHAAAPQPPPQQSNDRLELLPPPTAAQFIINPFSPPTNPPAPKSRDVCHQKMNVGSCQGSFTSFYYEWASGTCIEFKYSGCGGNGNRFTSKSLCEESCVRSAGASGSESNECDEVKATGECPHTEGVTRPPYITKWFYDKDQGVCNRFHYSGCGGTRNRFESENECKSKCGNHVSPCDLPAVKGMCSGKYVNYFYNKATSTCETFEYSGCLGNSNRFASIEECQAQCPRNDTSSPSSTRATDGAISRCLQTKIVGPCRALIPSYYFDSSIGRCVPFNYGGCGGNGNRFESLASCQSNCEGERNQVGEGEEEEEKGDTGTEDDTRHPRRRGREEGGEDEDTTEQGEEGREGGHDEEESSSGGEGRRGGEEEEGTQVTTPLPTTEEPLLTSDNEEPLPSAFVPVSPIPELCLLHEQHGGCYGKELRFRYDDSRGMCVSFFWSGCNANANNFDSQESCERACGAFREDRVCEQRKDVGECSMITTPKYYWDDGAKKCSVFYYGGCAGNGNRFSSMEECKQLCTVETAFDKSTDICQMTTDAGPCSDQVTMWNYDARIGECRQFTYGGCRGNGNRFVTRDSCMHRCRGVQALATVPPPLPTASALIAPIIVPAVPSTPAPFHSSIHIDNSTAHEGHVVAQARVPQSVGLVVGREEVQSVPIQERIHCSLPSDGGSCTGSFPKWHFDPISSTCKQFNWGGCGGNDNRFDSHHECIRSCVASTRHRKSERAELRTREEGPFQTASEITLLCSAPDGAPVIWYKDEELLQFNDRVIMSRMGEVRISSAVPTDTGSYMCAVGAYGTLSPRVNIKINELPVTESFCKDLGGEDTCRKILAVGLCDNERYGKFCCRTCGSYGYEKFRF